MHVLSNVGPIKKGRKLMKSTKIIYILQCMGQFLNCLGLLTKTTKEKNIDHRK